MGALLLLDDCPDTTEAVVQLVAEREDWSVQTETRLEDALATMDARPVDLILVGTGEADERERVLERVRAEHRAVPVLCIAPDEDHASLVRTLALGAASYVPRGKLGAGLRDTIDRLLALSGRTDRRHLAPYIGSQQLTFELPADRALLPVAVRFARDWAVDLGVCEVGDALQLAVALDEALTNALVHGNLEVESVVRESDPGAYERLIQERLATEPFRGRLIRLELTFADDLATFRIEDEGSGFDPSSLPDPTARENVLRPHGRGVMLMRAFMDEVIFNERGNAVTLQKRR